MGTVFSLSLAPTYTFSKESVPRVRFIEGLGLEGDVHSGKTVKHRSRVEVDPTQPNLRQVHLIDLALIDELTEAGYDVSPGSLGENVLTEGFDLLTLPTGTRLRFGPEAVVELTGLRNPCPQLNGVGPDLLARLAFRDDDGDLVRRAGVMGIVCTTGEVAVGDLIEVTLPSEPHRPLEPV